MNRKTVHLTILSPEKKVFDGEVERVTLPGTAGVFTILPAHAPIVSTLSKGKVSYVSEEGEQVIEIQSGFVEMSNEYVSVCIS